jgi:hypothetical protein
MEFRLWFEVTVLVIIRRNCKWRHVYSIKGLVGVCSRQTELLILILCLIAVLRDDDLCSRKCVKKKKGKL